MDLSSMLNDNPAPARKPSGASSADGVKTGAQAVTPAASSNGAPPVVRDSYPPLYQTPSTYSKNGTPLQTPSGYSQGGSQYPFPQQQPPMLSPAINAPSAAQYSPVAAVSANAAGQRPPGHGQAYVQPPPLLHHGSSNWSQNAHTYHHNTSVSPTPPSSQHSHTPHSVRASPLATNTHLPGQYHQQATTPLGPPPLIQRQSQPYEVSSPYHQRTLSAASSVPPTGSPAQHHPSIGNLVESPQLLNRQSPQARRTSEYLQSVERERSISVSPKTRVAPRPSSMGSRHSSLQEVVYGEQSSAQSGVPGPSQPERHEAPLATKRDYGTLHNQHGAIGSSTVPQTFSQVPDPSSIAPLRRPSMTQEGSGALPPQDSVASGLPTKRSPSTDKGMPLDPPSLKRPAESEAPAQPPAKRMHRRKYEERPPWARLSDRNPRYQRTTELPGSSRDNQAADNARGTLPQKQPNGHTSQPNLSSASTGNGAQPLDQNLILGRRCLYPDWEKTFVSLTPIPSMLQVVFEWLSGMLANHADVGHNPLEGAIEIEAKIGTLISINDDQRCRLPTASATVIRPEINREYRFESRMDEDQHRGMNKFLNDAVAHSHNDPGRTRINYTHIRETDHFEPLSDLGLKALPPTARSRTSRGLRLRTSKDSATGAVTARIVKIPLGDLHIYNPTELYDCRISVNLEVNLARPDIDPAAIVDREGAGPPARRKDRLSYKHLAYAIDLTRVDVAGMPPKYELELEMDAAKLREQIALMGQGKEQDAMGLVEAFIDNAVLLMKQRPLPPPEPQRSQRN